MPRADAAPAVHRRRAALGGVLLICLGLPASRASTLVVDLDGGGHFTSIQAALDEAASGDTVLVRPGEYVIDEPIDFSRGLYPGQRLGDGDRSIALRSEAGAPATVIRMSESGGSSGRASLLVFESGETESTVVDGFTLTAGRGTLVGGSTYGGGVYCANGSSPILENLVIARNRATYGGALFCGDSSPRLVGCTLEANSVTCGGGAFCDAASPRFERCRIIGNRGMYASSGVHSKNGSAPTLIGCVVMGNATYMGGGVDGFGSWPTLINCVVAGNSAWKGAALYGEGSAFVVRSCTIADNRSGGGAGIFVQASSLEMVNTIVWPRESAPVSYLGSFCLTDVDPLFVSGGSFDLERFRILEIAGEEHEMPDFIAEAPDYRLRPRSPAIDAGRLDGAPGDDIDGHARPCGEDVDIGAFESCGDLVVFQRGDVRPDGALDISDPLSLLLFLFAAGREPICLKSGDADDSGRADVADAVRLVEQLFLGGAPPAAPYPRCGPDPTDDALPCEPPSICR